MLAASVLADSAHRALSRLVPEQGDGHAAGRLRRLRWRQPARHRRQPARPRIAVRDTRLCRWPALTGVVGTGFHVYNVAKRPGGFVWQNLFYGAPLGAPAALAAVGPARAVSPSGCATIRPATLPRMFGLPAGRALAAADRARAARHGGRGRAAAFPRRLPQPVHVAPVTMPPVAAALLAETALGRAGRDRWFTRWWLRLTAAAGLRRRRLPRLSACRRNMGGWRNWTPEPAERAAAPGAAQLHRPRARPGLPRSACWRITPMPDRFPGYDVLAKRDTPVVE